MMGIVQDVSHDRVLARVDDAVRLLVRADHITFTAASLLGRHLAVSRCAYAVVESDEDTFQITGNYTDSVASIVGTYRFRQFGAECLRHMRAGEPFVVEDSRTDARIDEVDLENYERTAIRAVICVPVLKAKKFVAAMAVHMNAPRTWSQEEVDLVARIANRSWESIERTRVEREREDLLHEAEAANRAKDEFMAMLGHELRNPLAPIVTALQLMKTSGENAFQRERTVIERQVEHLTRLVDDLLDVSRIAQGKVELKKELVELADIVARAIEISSTLLEQRAHSLSVDVPRAGLLVLADRGRLTQVVSNLLTNAGKYTPVGGKISVTAALDGDALTLSIRDNGIGIDASVLPHVFERFVQAEQAIDRAGGGLGLGLSIVKSLVERHEGTVSVASDGPNRGSEFIVRLPLAKHGKRSIDAEPPATAMPPKPTLRTRILVVDDNEDAAEMLAAVLELKGCDVHVAHDGPEALRLAETERFDAALLDIGLPVMDGYELAARLREFPTIKDAKLVAVTGYGQDADRKRAAQAGFDHHLVKPVDLAKLESIVAAIPASSERT